MKTCKLNFCVYDNEYEYRCEDCNYYTEETDEGEDEEDELFV